MLGAKVILLLDGKSQIFVNNVVAFYRNRQAEEFLYDFIAYPALLIRLSKLEQNKHIAFL